MPRSTNPASISNLGYFCRCHFDWPRLVFLLNPTYLAILQGPQKPARHMFVERELTSVLRRMWQLHRSRICCNTENKNKGALKRDERIFFHPFDPPRPSLVFPSVLRGSPVRASTIANVPLDDISLSIAATTSMGREFQGPGSPRPLYKCW